MEEGPYLLGYPSEVEVSGKVFQRDPLIPAKKAVRGGAGFA